ncbi:MAG: hypothetical protein ACFFAL_09370 [Promethearchaeota archaeon]
MGSNETASTLTLVGAIFNLLAAFGFLTILAISIIPVLMVVPELFVWVLFGIGIFLIPATIIGLIFGFIPLMWRQEPQEHKVGLIIIGVFSLASIGGLFLIIAGAIAETEGA